jgi:hypothetical protein
MTYEQFENIMTKLQKSDENTDVLYRHGVDVTDIMDHLHSVIGRLLCCVFTDEGKDWIEWFMFEKEFGKRDDLKAWDANKNEIAYDIKSLYELLINEYYNKK